MVRFRNRNVFLLLAFSILAIAVMGYHPGIEDDGVYLPAVKHDLNPALYPHDSAFFCRQLQATFFDKWVAGFIRLTHIPVAMTELLWQFGSILLILYGCWSIARKLFDDEWVQWAGVAMVAAMLTLPVSGTALYLADQHLHPRNIATALVLVAISRIFSEKLWQAVPLLMLAFVLHPIMAALGVSYCFFLTMALREPAPAWLRALRRSPAAVAPLAWIFEPPNRLWLKALHTRDYCFLYYWTWYEWLGVIAPLFLFWLLWRIAKKQGKTTLSRFAFSVFVYGIFQLIVALIMTTPPSFIRLMPLQPMRFLQLIYYFMALLAGCLLGKYFLKASVWRWAVFLLVINGGMLISQLMLFPSSPHLELPGERPSNPWLQAFSWIRHNTPTDAYFALNPYYLAAPGEDYHSFRALAERSQMADAIKDTAVVTQVPDLAQDWYDQVEAETGWSHFQLADFERLKKQFGVNWALVEYPPPAGLACQWQKGGISVCRIP